MLNMEETYENWSDYLFSTDEKNVEIGVYSIALVGLAAAIRTVRPFKRFSRPSDIPARFIKFRTKLHGTVQRVEPNGALLMVQHKPVIPIFKTKVDELPVKISGITINGNGISWLQTIVSGNNINFIPVLTKKDCVQCEVTMNQKLKNGKIKSLNIASNLVEIGFGQIDKIDNKLALDPFYQSYLNQLKSAELTAEKKRLGYWYYMKFPRQASIKFINFLVALLNKQKNKKTPKKLSSEATVKTATA